MLIVDQLKRGDPKLRWLALSVLGGMLVLTCGLWFLQVVNHKKYEENLITQSYRTVRLPAVRGRILDRNGVILAESRPSYNVNLYLEELRPYFTDQYYLLKSNALYRIKLEDAELPDGKKRKRLKSHETEALERQARYMVVRGLVGRISQILQVPLELTEKDFRKHYEGKRSLPLAVVENLSPSQVARFAEGASSLPGVELQVQSLRSYPLGQTAAHLLGYMTRTEKAPTEEEEIEFDYRLPDFKGAVGVEAVFDEQLRGVAGAKTLLVNNMLYRQAENIWLPPKSGDDVILTIDADVQKASENALKSQGLGVKGAVVVMDVRNGDLLAMASAPTFDPNTFVPNITHAEYARINNPETKPMLNRASFAIYQPGSAFKIVIALAALEAGELKPDEQFYSKGFYTMPGHRWDCTAGAGHFDFRRAFIKSCNCYFIDHGLDVGLDNILRIGHQFCLGEKTGLPTRQDIGGYFPEVGTRKKNMGGPWTAGDTANLSIGQGDIAVTPIQMAVLTAAVANNGKVYWPRLVERLEADENGFRTVSEEFPAGRLRNELKVHPQNLRLVQEAMRDDVSPEGTGKLAAVPGWQVCGKTGTAVVRLGRARETSRFTWFVSYAPFDSPRYAVVVMVENGGSGGGTCAPIARRVYEALQKMEQTSRLTGPNLVLGNR